MIVSVDTLMTRPEFKHMDVGVLTNTLDAIETLIRSHTNNTFQNRNVRFVARISQNEILGNHPFLRVGDTMQISESKVNNGLYVVKRIENGRVIVDKDLFDVSHALITKVEYPADVVLGAINLARYECEMRDKIGIKSETISRHSVTYFDMNDSNQVMGYPKALLGFLKPYMKARF